MISKFQDHDQDCWCTMCTDVALEEQALLDSHRQSRQVFTPPSARRGKSLPNRKQKRRPE